MNTAAGPVPRVDAAWSAADSWGRVKVRWGVGRMRYTVLPGLYALGDPDPDSPVLVTANYKLSFDHLRRAMAGHDAWILVLDTRGVNVWCAAGKGTFGTEELVGRVVLAKLAQVVTHRRLVLPQLGAPGIAGFEVARRCGFRVSWGPVRADDLPEYLAAGRRATPEMRRKSFGIGERCALVPVELVAALKVLLPVAAAVAVLAGLGGGPFPSELADHGVTAAAVLLGAVLAGAVLAPLLLPWLPGRAFSVKGAALGLVVGITVVAARGAYAADLAHRVEATGWLLVGAALAAFLTMNFTGSSTFTSLSGVRREMRVAVPLQAAGAVAGLVLFISGRWLL